MIDTQALNENMWGILEVSGGKNRLLEQTQPWKLF